MAVVVDAVSPVLSWPWIFLIVIVAVIVLLKLLPDELEI